jgi:hypothetical protein
MKKAFLILLVIVCIAVVVWVAYLLFTNQTDPVMGGIILVVDIGVLIWNISVLRAYRIGARNVVAAFLMVALIAMTVSAFAGIEPFAGLKDKVIDSFSRVTTTYDVEISPGQTREVEDWRISVDGGGWKGGTLTVELTITNLGLRRNFGDVELCINQQLWGQNSGPELVAVDSTQKVVKPWVPESTTIWDIHCPPYTKEFYPNESWTGSLKFEMSSYSGRTALYLDQHGNTYFLFYVGEPKR